MLKHKKSDDVAPHEDFFNVSNGDVPDVIIAADLDDIIISHIGEISVYLDPADASAQSIPNDDKRKTRPTNRISERVFKQSNETNKQHGLVRINVPPFGDCPPQACLVDNSNVNKMINQEKDQLLSKLKW